MPRVPRPQQLQTSYCGDCFTASPEYRKLRQPELYALGPPHLRYFEECFWTPQAGSSRNQLTATLVSTSFPNAIIPVEDVKCNKLRNHQLHRLQNWDMAPRPARWFSWVNWKPSLHPGGNDLCFWLLEWQGQLPPFFDGRTYRPFFRMASYTGIEKMIESWFPLGQTLTKMWINGPSIPLGVSALREKEGTCIFGMGTCILKAVTGIRNQYYPEQYPRSRGQILRHPGMPPPLVS
jgi:hypothetical protein